MKKQADVLVDGSDYLLSFKKMIPEGVSIVDIQGYMDTQYMVFKICFVVLSDGTTVIAGGEHDCPYLEDIPGASEEQMDEFYDKDDVDEDDEEEEDDDEG